MFNSFLNCIQHIGWSTRWISHEINDSSRYGGNHEIPLIYRMQLRVTSVQLGLFFSMCSFNPLFLNEIASKEESSTLPTGNYSARIILTNGWFLTPRFRNLFFQSIQRPNNWNSSLSLARVNKFQNNRRAIAGSDCLVEKFSAGR